MRRGVLVVESRPASAERAAEYHHWYDDVHLPDVLAVPGFVSARRFRVCDRATGVPDPDELGHVTIYELEADDLAQPLRELREGRSGERTPPDGVISMDPPPRVTLYEQLD